MNHHLKRGLATAFLLAACAVQAQDLQRLGKDLTPVGAEKAGNADGSIPAWSGGLTQPPAGFDRSKGYADPYAGEKPLYVVTAANAAQYAALLAPGQLEMLKRYPESYKLRVFPTHRSAAHPDWYPEVVKRDAAKARLAENGGVQNVAGAPTVPFPIPTLGVQVIENHKLRYRVDSVQMNVSVGAVQANGAFTPIRWNYELDFAGRMPDAEPNRIFYFKQQTLSPSNAAGESTLMWETIDTTQEPRSVWTYNPGQRRVLRAPDVGYDSPYFNVDGLATIDDSDMFAGATDRYEWKLVGKKEMLISYNNYALASKQLKYADVIKAGHINQDLTRYEKHRVWVVEATLKPGARHIYGKRVFYVDEDTWQVAHVDQYDMRGGLWRVHEGHAIHYYDLPGTWYALDTQYDLQARRYFFSYLGNEDKVATFNRPKSRANYSPDSLRRVN